MLIGGRELPVVGRICMDHAFVDVTELVASGLPVTREDEVVLIGEQHGSTISVEDAAARLKSNNYEVASRLMARLPRIATHNWAS